MGVVHFFAEDAVLGSFGAPLGCPGRLLGRSWGCLGLFCSCLGPSCACLVLSGAHWASLGAVLGGSLAVFGLSWGSVGLSWGSLGLSWGSSGLSLGAKIHDKPTFFMVFRLLLSSAFLDFTQQCQFEKTHPVSTKRSFLTLTGHQEREFPKPKSVSSQSPKNMRFRGGPWAPWALWLR